MDTTIEIDEHERASATPVALVPTPTREYRTHRKLVKATVQPGAPVAAAAVALPAAPPTPVGARALIWKQDPATSEIGLRKVFLPGNIVSGPRDARIANGSPGIPPVTPNAFGDFIQTPGTDPFDAVQVFAVVRQTLAMYQRAFGGAPLPWQWNSSTNTDPLSLFPHGLPDTMNAFYNRADKALYFGDFVKPGSTPPERVFTCRSLDIVAHECGHAILDGLKPSWLSAGNPPQTGGLHESFGDLTAIFLSLSQLDQVEAVIAQTKANLHDKTFLSDLAEEFGLALGRPNGVRNADNDLTLSDVGTEIHALSQVFTGAIYDILADIFAYRRNTAKLDDAVVLLETAQYVMSLVLRSFVAAPSVGVTFADVVNQMITIAAKDGKPVKYRNFIRNRFQVRQVVISPTPLTVDHQEGTILTPGIHDAEGSVQNRRGCCGTMTHAEYNRGDELLAEEIEAFRASFRSNGRPKLEP